MEFPVACLFTENKSEGEKATAKDISVIEQ